jgi:O-antigen/teichoic acid export membrane protein
MTEAFPATAQIPLESIPDKWRLRRIRQTTGASWVNQATNIASKIVVIPLSLGVLGQARFGAWLTLLAIVAWFGMSDWGTTSALINPLAKSIGAQRSEETQSLVSTGFYFLSAVGIALALPCVGLVWLLPTEHLLGLRGSGVDVDLRLAVTIVLGLNVCLYNLQMTTVIASAMQRGYLSAIGEIVGRILTVVGLVFLNLRHDGSLAAFALAVTVPVVIQRLVLYVLLCRRDSAFIPIPRRASRERLKSILGASSAFFLGGCGELLYTQTPNIVIAQILGASSVAVYAVTYQVFFSVFLLVSMLSLPLWPAIADAYQSGKVQWIRSSFRSIMRSSLALAAVGFGLLAIGGGAVIARWLGPAFRPSSLLMIVFALHFLQWTFNTVCMAAATGLGYLRERAMMVIALGLTNVVLSVIGARLWGLVGVGVAQLASMTVTQTWYLPYLLHRRAPWLYAQRAG